MQVVTIRKRLQGMVKRQGLREVARILGVDAGNLCHVLKGRRQPGPTLLKAMGYRSSVDVVKSGNGGVR